MLDEISADSSELVKSVTYQPNKYEEFLRVLECTPQSIQFRQELRRFASAPFSKEDERRWPNCVKGRRAAADALRKAEERKSASTSECAAELARIIARAEWLHQIADRYQTHERRAVELYRGACREYAKQHAADGELPRLSLKAIAEHAWEKARRLSRPGRNHKFGSIEVQEALSAQISSGTLDAVAPLVTLGNTVVREIGSDIGLEADTDVRVPTLFDTIKVQPRGKAGCESVWGLTDWWDVAKLKRLMRLPRVAYFYSCIPGLQNSRNGEAWNFLPASMSELVARGVLPARTPERARGPNSGRARFSCSTPDPSPSSLGRKISWAEYTAPEEPFARNPWDGVAATALSREAPHFAQTKIDLANRAGASADEAWRMCVRDRQCQLAAQERDSGETVFLEPWRGAHLSANVCPSSTIRPRNKKVKDTE